MAWLRVYDDMLDNPKIQRLPDKAFRERASTPCRIARQRFTAALADVEATETRLKQAIIEANSTGALPDEYAAALITAFGLKEA